MCLSTLSFLITASCWNWKRKGSLSKSPCPATENKLKHSSPVWSSRVGWDSRLARKVNGLIGIQVSTHHLSVNNANANMQSPLPPKTWYRFRCRTYLYISRTHIYVKENHTHTNTKLCFLSLSLAMRLTSNTRWYHSSLGPNSAVSLIFTRLLST